MQHKTEMITPRALMSGIGWVCVHWGGGGGASDRCAWKVLDGYAWGVRNIDDVK